MVEQGELEWTSEVSLNGGPRSRLEQWWPEVSLLNAGEK